MDSQQQALSTTDERYLEWGERKRAAKDAFEALQEDPASVERSKRYVATKKAEQTAHARYLDALIEEQRVRAERELAV